MRVNIEEELLDTLYYQGGQGGEKDGVPEAKWRKYRSIQDKLDIISSFGNQNKNCITQELWLIPPLSPILEDMKKCIMTAMSIICLGYATQVWATDPGSTWAVGDKGHMWKVYKTMEIKMITP